MAILLKPIIIHIGIYFLCCGFASILILFVIFTDMFFFEYNMDFQRTLTFTKYMGLNYLESILSTTIFLFILNFIPYLIIVAIIKKFSISNAKTYSVCALICAGIYYVVLEVVFFILQQEFLFKERPIYLITTPAMGFITGLLYFKLKVKLFK